MRKSFLVAFVLLLAAVPSLAGDKKKNRFIMNKNADQWVELANVADVVAEQPCGNWALAAGMEASLRRQKVELDQRFWIMRLNGGLLCMPSAGSFETIKNRIDGEYVLADGRHVRIEVRYRESLPESTDALMLPLAHGRPYLLWWKDQPYLVKGATWDELIYQTGQKLIEIKTLKMVNTLEKGAKRDVVFDREKDDTNDLSAMFDIVVSDMADIDPFTPPRNKATEPVENPAVKK